MVMTRKQTLEILDMFKDELEESIVTIEDIAHHQIEIVHDDNTYYFIDGEFKPWYKDYEGFEEYLNFTDYMTVRLLRNMEKVFIKKIQEIRLDYPLEGDY